MLDRPSRRAVTLIELLVAIGIVGLLLGLLLPAVAAARESARRSLCRTRLHDLGIALANYQATTGMLPSSGSMCFSLRRVL